MYHVAIDGRLVQGAAQDAIGGEQGSGEALPLRTHGGRRPDNPAACVAGVDSGGAGAGVWLCFVAVCELFSERLVHTGTHRHVHKHK